MDPIRPDDEHDSTDLDELGASPTIAVGRKAPSAGAGGPARRRPGRLVLIVIVAVLLALVPLAVSGLVKTPRDKVGISYGGGPIEGSHYQRIIEPGSSLSWNGILDSLYLYPADQQNLLLVAAPEGEGATGAISAPSQDRVQVTYEVAVYFKLNTDRLRDFHEQFGLRYEAYFSDGWDELLQDTMRQQMESTFQEETRRLSVSELYGNAEQLVAVQNSAQTTLSRRLRDAMGGQFFCSPTFVPGGECDDPVLSVRSISIPEGVAKAFESNRISLAQVQTELNQVEQRKAEALGIEAISDALEAAGDDYVLLKAIESGQITFWVLPSDSGVTLTTPDSATSGTTPTPGG